jgi:hypothetical protein
MVEPQVSRNGLRFDEFQIAPYAHPVCVAPFRAAPGRNLLRSVFIITWAISLSQPSMSTAQRTSYAKIVREQAQKHRIDPFTLVAIIHHESRWRPNAVSRDGEDHGLGQIRARFEKACRKDADPVKAPSPGCKRAKMSLLNGTYNIRRMAGHIANWRKTCRKITGQPALFKRWLHGYGGMGKRSHRGWVQICGQRPTKKGWVDIPVRRQLRNIMNYRKRLIRLSKRQRPSRAGRGGTTARSRQKKRNARR